jgi:hypothetical protein
VDNQGIARRDNHPAEVIIVLIFNPRAQRCGGCHGLCPHLFDAKVTQVARCINWTAPALNEGGPIFYTMSNSEQTFSLCSNRSIFLATQAMFQNRKNGKNL